MVLNLHAAGAQLVTKWKRRDVAVAEPSDASSEILARTQRRADASRRSAASSPMASRGVSPQGRQRISDQGLAQRPSMPLSAPPVPGADMVSDTLVDRLQRCGNVLHASDGSGCIWRCTYSSSHRLPGSLEMQPVSEVHTLLLQEWTPVSFVSEAELGAASQLLHSRVVVCPSSVSESLRNAVLQAGASGVLTPDVQVHRDSGQGGSHPPADVQSVVGLLQQLQTGMAVSEVLQQQKLCGVQWQLWDASGTIVDV